MAPRTSEERELQRRLRKQLMAQGIDPDTVPEAAMMSLDPAMMSEEEGGPLLESGTGVDVGVGQVMLEATPSSEVPLEAVGAPGPAAMSEIAGAQEQEAALPAPMTEQEGMAPPPEAAVAEGQLPSPEELPDIPAEDPIDEELAQRAGQVEAQQGGALRSANQGLVGALRGGLGKLLAPGAKDPEKLAQSQEAMAEADVLEGQRDEARLKLDEEREALQVARTATIQARSSAEAEKSLQLQEDVDQRERFEQEAQTKSAESVATVREEYEKFKAMKIDPDRAMNEMSTGRKISFVLLGMLGGLFEAAAADGGQKPTGPSVADTIIRRIDTIIKRDIAAQKSAIGQQRDVLGQAFNMDASVNKSLRDQGARLEASQALRWNALVGKLDAEIEKTDEPAKIAELGETKALAEQREKNSWAESKRLEGRRLLKESQYSALDIQTAQAERNFRGRRADAAAGRALQREDLAMRRQDRKDDLARGERRYQEGRELQLKREGRYTEKQQSKRRSEYIAKTEPVYASLAQSKQLSEFLTGPNAPNLAQIKLHEINWLPTGLSSEDSQRLKEWKQYMVRYIKEMTGLASPGRERADIKSSLQRTFDSAEDLALTLKNTEKWAQKKLDAYDVSYSDVSDEVRQQVRGIYDKPAGETPRTGLKRRLDAREPPKRGGFRSRRRGRGTPPTEATSPADGPPLRPR